MKPDRIAQLPYFVGSHGAFVGEMPYLRGGAATARVRARTPVRYLAWSKARLFKLLRRDPSVNLALKTVVGLDLAKKLNKVSSTSAVASSR